MTWKHIPLDVINAVRFVVVPWKKRTQKRPYTNHSFNIIVSLKNPTNNTFSKSLTVPVYRLFISKTNLEKTLNIKQISRSSCIKNSRTTPTETASTWHLESR